MTSSVRVGFDGDQPLARARNRKIASCGIASSGSLPSDLARPSPRSPDRRKVWATVRRPRDARSRRLERPGPRHRDADPGLAATSSAPQRRVASRGIRRRACPISSCLKRPAGESTRMPTGRRPSVVIGPRPGADLVWQAWRLGSTVRRVFAGPRQPPAVFHGASAGSRPCGFFGDGVSAVRPHRTCRRHQRRGEVGEDVVDPGWKRSVICARNGHGSRRDAGDRC
jgi:hypothetical protein